MIDDICLKKCIPFWNNLKLFFSFSKIENKSINGNGETNQIIKRKGAKKIILKKLVGPTVLKTNSLK